MIAPSKYSKIPYGNPPKVLGEIDLQPTEHMLYLYLPIRIAGKPGPARLPQNLKYLQPLLQRVYRDCVAQDLYLINRHIYVTVKTCWVEPGAPGNRPGWHADGYGSNGDLNYIWYNMNPTQFAVMPFYNIPDDDYASMQEMERQINALPHRMYAPETDPIREYPCKTLLRLNESVVHRVNPRPKAGLRTFIKVSVSKHKYNLRGNSHNYLLDYNWEMHDRQELRNVDNKDFVK
jgi:hypothetical protein